MFEGIFLLAIGMLITSYSLGYFCGFKQGQKSRDAEIIALQENYNLLSNSTECW